MIKKVYLWSDTAIRYLFYCHFFFVPLVLSPYTSEIFEFNKLVLTYILTTLIVFFWLIKMIIGRKIIYRRTILEIPLILFLISQILSTYISIDRYTSIFGYYSRFNGGLLSVVSYILLYFSFVSNMDQKSASKTIKFILVSSMLVSIYGIMEHFGIDKHVWVQDVVERVFSTFGQPNWLAAFLVGVVPFAWVIFTKSKRILYLFPFLIFFVTLLFTKSRSGILGFVIASVIFWGGYILKIKSKKVFSALLPASLITIVIVAVVGTPWTPSVNKLLTKSVESSPPKTQVIIPALESGGTESGDIRKIVWKGALTIFKKYPFLGSGVETFAYAYYQVRPKEHNLTSEWEFLYNKAHNEYLNYLATTGVFGFTSYLLILGASIVIFIKLFKKDYLYSLAFTSGYIGIAFTNIFGFSVVPISLLIFLLPALAVTFQVDKGVQLTNIPTLKGVIPIALLLILTCCTGYVLLSVSKYYQADIYYNQARVKNNAGNFGEANRFSVKAIQLSPFQSPYYDELAQSLTGLAIQKFDDKLNDEATTLAESAIDAANKAVLLSPRNINMVKAKASVYLKLSGFDPNLTKNVISILDYAITLAPTEPKLYYNQALLYSKLGNMEYAIEDLKKSIDLKPDYYDPRYALALIYKGSKDSNGAKDQLNYILNFIAPNDGKAKALLDSL